MDGRMDVTEKSHSIGKHPFIKDKPQPKYLMCADRSRSTLECALCGRFMDFYMSFSRGSPPLSSSAWPTEPRQRPKLNHIYVPINQLIHHGGVRAPSVGGGGGEAGPGFSAERTHDNDELGLAPRQRAALIHYSSVQQTDKRSK